MAEPGGGGLQSTDRSENVRPSFCATHTNDKQCSRQLQCEAPCSVGVVNSSSLFINSSLSSTTHAVCRGSPGGSGHGRGGLSVAGGRGHFGPAAIYCTTTWCFAQKGLRTNTRSRNKTPFVLNLKSGPTGGAPPPPDILPDLSLNSHEFTLSSLNMGGTSKEPVSKFQRATGLLSIVCCFVWMFCCQLDFEIKSLTGGECCGSRENMDPITPTDPTNKWILLSLGSPHPYPATQILNLLKNITWTRGRPP